MAQDLSSSGKKQNQNIVKQSDSAGTKSEPKEVASAGPSTTDLGKSSSSGSGLARPSIGANASIAGNGSGQILAGASGTSPTRDQTQEKESVMEKRAGELKSGDPSSQSSGSGSSRYGSSESGRSSGRFKRDAEEIKQQALSLGEKFVEQTSDQFFSLIDDQKEVLRDEVKSFVKALRQASSKLKEEDHNAVARYTDSLGDSIEDYMEKLARKNANQVISDIEAFARSKPAVFIAGALIGGFIFSRFMKSGSEKRGHHQLSEEWEAQGMPRGHAPSLDNGGPGLNY
jgi:hypothetical protein